MSMPMEMITDETQTERSGFYWREVDGVRALVCAPLEQDGFTNGFSTRMGGVSPLPHDALNLAGFNEDAADVEKAFSSATSDPIIALWHEPDLVDMLPPGRALLQLSGHSHGGQFKFPFGLTPMTSTNGHKYRDGFYPDASTPIFVTRGVGTTGPPSRFLCPPQVAVLTLTST